MNVCDNLGDHLVGNVYIKVNLSLIIHTHTECSSFLLQFRFEEDAEKAVQALNNRWFNGHPIHAELSPVTDFKEACCRQYDMG